MNWGIILQLCKAEVVNLYFFIGVYTFVIEATNIY